MYKRVLNCEINITAGDTENFFMEVKKIKLADLLPIMIGDSLLNTSNYP